MNALPFWGIDACKGGWFCVGLGDGYDCFVESCVADVYAQLDKRNAKVALIDMPIGLPASSGVRSCDAFAKEKIGKKFSATVFPVPCRQAIDEYRQTEGTVESKKSAMWQKHFKETKQKLTPPACSFSPKIAELDTLLLRGDNVSCMFREVHPELCFRALKGSPLCASKKHRDGINERLDLLMKHYPHLQNMSDICLRMVGKRPGKISGGVDDVLDALVAAVTAKLGHDSTAYRAFPPQPQKDKHGLPMQMWFVDLHDSL